MSWVNAGCASVGVSYGAHAPGAFEPLGPRFVAHSVAELTAQSAAIAASAALLWPGPAAAPPPEGVGGCGGLLHHVLEEDEGGAVFALLIEGGGEAEAGGGAGGIETEGAFEEGFGFRKATAQEHQLGDVR
mgnify:CR=1 FL=1